MSFCLRDQSSSSSSSLSFSIHLTVPGKARGGILNLGKTAEDDDWTAASGLGFPGNQARPGKHSRQS
jgi:hypothetical protein